MSTLKTVLDTTKELARAAPHVITNDLDDVIGRLRELALIKRKGIPASFIYQDKLYTRGSAGNWWNIFDLFAEIGAKRGLIYSSPDTVRKIHLTWQVKDDCSIQLDMIEYK